MQPQQNNNTNNPVLQFYQKWSDQTPFVTKTVTLLLIACYILSFFFNADLTLGNVTYFTLMKLEIYRFIFSPIVGNSLLILILIGIFMHTFYFRCMIIY
jgi:hypothetical protein